MAGEWYVGRNGQQSGPFTAQQLREMAAAGQLSSDDLLWKNGMPSWVPCSSVKGLFPESTAVSGPPPTRPAPRPVAPPPRSTAVGGSFGDSDEMGFGDPAGFGVTAVGATPTSGFEYAEFLPRVGAFLLDNLFVGLMGCVPALGIGFVFMAMASGGSRESQEAASVMSSCCGQIVGLLIGLIYFVTLESSTKQATWGKQIVGIKVTDLEGNRITFGRALGRYFAKIITGFTCGIGLLMPLFTEKKQTLHDMISGCLSLKK